jgi:hypothetical protein
MEEIFFKERTPNGQKAQKGGWLSGSSGRMPASKT